MSEEAENDSKTEEPTEKRRTDALEHQGGPFSREAGSAAVLLAFSLFLATSAPSLVSNTARQLAIFIEDPGGWRLESGADAVLLLQTVLVAISGLLTTFASIVVVAAIAASVLQNPPRFYLRPHRAGLVPRLDRRWN